MAPPSVLERIDDALSSPRTMRLLSRPSVPLGELEEVVLSLLAQADAQRRSAVQAIEAGVVRDRIVLWRDAASLATFG
jgi:hypothetical protein